MLVENEEIDTYAADHAHLFETLEHGPDGKPGGILITSVGQEVLPHIWLGGYKALETLTFLQKNKITHILSLGHFKPVYKPDQFIQKIIPITDNPESNIIQYFMEAIEFIDTAIIEKGSNVLIHCLAGVSRSPTIVTAYLMHKKKLRFKEALAIIKQTRPFVNPNPGFIEQLKLFREMGYQFDKHNPAYIEYLEKHPIDAAHLGHDEYNH